MKLDYQTLKSLTYDESFQAVLDLARQAGYPLTSFQSGDVGYTLLKTIALVIQLFSEPVEKTTLNLFAKTAIGTGLDLIGRFHFNEIRIASSPTKIVVKLKNSGIIAVSRAAEESQIKVFYGIDSDGNDVYVTFKNTSAFNINSNSSLEVEYVSEIEGEESRVSGINQPIFVIDIPLVTFETISTNVYFELTSLGNNIETDDDYRNRLLLKWSTLSANTPEESIKYWIINAINSDGNAIDVNRIYIDLETAAYSGSAVVYLACENGALSSDDLTAADANVQKYRGINDIVFVSNAIENEINYNISVTLDSTSGKNNTALKNDIINALTELYASIDIGGTKLVTGDVGYVLTSDVIDYLMEISGVIDVKINNKYSNGEVVTSTDIPLVLNEIPVISDDQINSISISTK